MDFQEAYPDTSSCVAAAVVSGDIKLLKTLIKSGKAVDVKDNRGWQPVHEAAFHGNIACLKEILKCGIDVDSTTFEEQTPLMLACKKGHSKCVSCLLKSGADPNSTTNEDYFPLWEASVYGSLECMKLLLSGGADVNKRIFTLDTALHGVIHHHDDSKCLPLVKCLVEAGIDLTIQDEFGLTAVFIAAQFGRTECLQYLLTCADERGNTFKKELVNKAASDDATPLYLATQNGNVDCVRILLQNGANADIGIIADEIMDSDFIITPLQMALYKGKKKCIEMLLPATDLNRFTWEMNNFDPEAKMNYNPVAIAASLESEECLRLLLDNPFFSNLYSGEKNLTYLEEKNLFSFDIKIRPAILLTRKFEPFIEECFRRNKSALHNCIACILENGYEYFAVFILMLRLGVNVDYPRYWLDHVSMASCCLGYFCAMLKYTVKGNNRREKKGLERLIDEDLSVSKVPVKHFSIRKLQYHLTTYSETVRREEKLKEKMEEGFNNLINQDGIPSLQNLCRKTIVLQLIQCSCYTRKSVHELHAPKLIHSYLLYEEDKSFSEAVLRAFEQVEHEENNIDKLFDDIKV